MFSILAGLGRRAVTFDPPGAYASTRRPDVSMREMLECSIEVMKIAGIETPVDVVGHSMGGLCALALAIEYDDIVDKLIVIDSLTGGPAVRRHRALPYNWRFQSRNFRRFVRHGLKAATGVATLRDHKILQRIVMNASYHDEFYLASHLADIGPDNPADRHIHAPARNVWPTKIARLDYVKRLTSINVPTLIIAGRYDPQVPQSAAEEMHAGVRGSRLVFFEESAHYPFIEEPDRFIRELQSFL